MIYGRNSSKVYIKTALQAIEEADILFYLTGSRFFGTFTEASDWDFFTQVSQKVEQFLKQNGFKLEFEGAYKDDPCICQVFKRDNVHVQLVKDMRIKYWVQWKLWDVFRSMKPSKDHAKLLWSIGMKLYYAGMEEQERITLQKSKAENSEKQLVEDVYTPQKEYEDIPF